MKILKWLGVILGVLALILGVLGYKVYQNIGDLPDESRFAELSYYQNGEFISPKQLGYYPEKAFGDAVWIGKSKNFPKQPLPQIKLGKDSFGKASEFAYYWLGHSSAIIELNGVRTLIDPVFNNAAPLEVNFIVKRFGEAPISRDELPSIDIVLITHDHYDHLERSTMIELKERVLNFVVPLGVGARLVSWGVDKSKIIELGWGESVEISGVKYTAEPTVHYSSRWRNDRNKTLWAAFVLQGAGRQIYWGGDSGYGTHFENAGKKYTKFDFAFLEIDAFNPGWPNTHMFPAEAVQASIELNASVMLPIHWGIFNLGRHPWNLGIKMAYENATKMGVTLHAPKMGERYTGENFTNQRWWESLDQ